MNKKTAFLVDDDPDYLFQTKLMLEKIGFNVVTADNQKDAEKMLETLKPDIFIFDLMMESEDSGFILSYKAKQRYPEIPVIIATAVASETGISFSIENSLDKNWIKADLYLEKGLRPDQLQRELNRVLKM